jgi:hypothetical protein
VLYSDIGLLAQIGLLPPCMLGSEGAEGELSPAFYAEVAANCE